MKPPSRARLGALAALLATLSACGSNDAAGSSAASASATSTGGAGTSTSASSSHATGSGGAGGESTTSGSTGGGGAIPYPAPHPDAPQEQALGGPILSAPVFVPVFFSDEDPTLAASLEDFAGKLATSQYWSSIGAEYGVGAATVLPAVHLVAHSKTMTTSAAISDYVATLLNGDTGVLPPADANTIYVFYYPPTTTITWEGGYTSCVDVIAFHGGTVLDDAHGDLQVSYGVIADCPPEPGFSELDYLTIFTSHELFESATDPHGKLAPAYDQLDDDHYAWSFLFGYELADVCEQESTAFFTDAEIGYAVQRVWSNAAAKAGHDPCVPVADGAVYFSSVPELDDDITFDGPRGTVTTKGVHVPIGKTRTIDIDLFSDAPTKGDWEVQAIDASSAFAGPALLDLALDHSNGKNGDKLKLTVTPHAAGEYGIEEFLLYSTKGNDSSFWIGVVGN